MITAQELRRILRYDPLSGKWFWRVKKTEGKQYRRPRLGYQGRVGKETGKSIGSSGYRQMRLQKHTYSTARLAFLYMTGRWPKTVDHINRIRTDDRWTNLREASSRQQAINRNKPNKTGQKHVFRHKGFYGIHVIGFKTAQEAGAVAAFAAKKRHPDYFAK